MMLKRRSRVTRPAVFGRAPVRGAPVDREARAGSDFRATAIRMSAASAGSLTRIAKSLWSVALGRSDAAAKILSVRIVRLFGVVRWRPPRRSPGFEPRGMVGYLDMLC